VVFAAVVALLCCLIGPSPMATAATRTPSVPAGLPAGIERLAAYVPANSCGSATRPGTDKLGRLLTSTYPGTSYGGLRGCGTLPTSEHFDGRAVDWMNSIRNTTQAAQGKAVISWLLATDNQDQQYANARRLGVMYVIWNNKIWGAYSADRGWRPYSSCADHPERGWDTTCHRDHMHISLSWAGAMAHTSFWSDKVAAEDYGRCRPADMNWAYGYKAPNSIACERSGVVRAPSGSSALRKTLTTYSGRPLRSGSKGSAVKAVQQAVGITVSGTYGAGTVTAVKKWQSDHQLTASGSVNYATWRTLLKAG
jgi:hypothetical protein